MNRFRSDSQAGWKPGVTTTIGVDPMMAMAERFAKMTPEEQEDYIADLRAQAAKKAQEQ